MSNENKPEQDNDADYYVGGKRVDKATWIKHLTNSPMYLDEEIRKLSRVRHATSEEQNLIDGLRALRNVLTHNTFSSGVSAALEANTDPTWFKSWARSELPDVLAQSQLKALTLFDEQKEKRENTWSARLRRYAGGLISGVILAILGVLVMWTMGLIGLK